VWEVRVPEEMSFVAHGGEEGLVQRMMRFLLSLVATRERSKEKCCAADPRRLGRHGGAFPGFCLFLFCFCLLFYVLFF
jgi:hypothetical protein